MRRETDSFKQAQQSFEGAKVKRQKMSEVLEETQ